VVVIIRVFFVLQQEGQQASAPTFATIAAYGQRQGGRTPQEVWEASFSLEELLPWNPGGLLSTSIAGDATELCNIYLENMMRGETITVLVCGHSFHFNCILVWLRVNKSCPTCRAVV